MSDQISEKKSNIRSAELAVKYVMSKMTIGAGNKISDIISSLIKPEWSVTCVSRIREEPFYAPYTVEKLRTIAERAAQAGCGNCGEQAAIAFIWLYDRKVGPLDYMSRTNADHAFVAIGRTGPIDNVAEWGDDCVICDPWDEEAYSVHEVGRKMYGGGFFAPKSVIRSTPPER